MTLTMSIKRYSKWLSVMIIHMRLINFSLRTFYIHYRELQEFKNNLSYETKTRNIVLAISKQKGYFSLLVPIVLGLIKSYNDEELVFWMAIGFLSKPCIIPFLNCSETYGTNFHFYMISKLVKEMDIKEIFPLNSEVAKISMKKVLSKLLENNKIGRAHV